MNLVTIQNNLQELYSIIDQVRIQVNGIRSSVDELQSELKNFSSDIEDIKAIAVNRQRTFHIRFEDQSSIKIMAMNIEAARTKAIAKHRLSITTIQELPNPATPTY